VAVLVPPPQLRVYQGVVAKDSNQDHVEVKDPSKGTAAAAAAAAAEACPRQDHVRARGHLRATTTVGILREGGMLVGIPRALRVTGLAALPQVLRAAAGPLTFLAAEAAGGLEALPGVHLLDLR
jgi:hypothetical protein